MTFLRSVLLVLTLAACGCARHTRPLVRPAELSQAEKNFQAVWDAAAEVLVSYRFTVDQRDRRAGLIITEPLAGRHFFEWWRRDEVTASGALENTVQPIYRVASVHINKAGDGSYSPVVTITVSRRLAMPKSRKAPTREDFLVLGVGTSDESHRRSGKPSPSDDLLAGRIANDIRALAAKKLAGETLTTGQKIIRFLGG